jgi:hypothetical protein
MDETIEGWYSDPFARHEARWMSQGNPTSLVRDGAVEGSDPVANGPAVAVPVRIETGPAENASDLLRADDAERALPYEHGQATRNALDAFDQSNP